MEVDGLLDLTLCFFDAGVRRMGSSPGLAFKPPSGTVTLTPSPRTPSVHDRTNILLLLRAWAVGVQPRLVLATDVVDGNRPVDRPVNLDDQSVRCGVTAYHVDVALKVSSVAA